MLAMKTDRADVQSQDLKLQDYKVDGKRKTSCNMMEGKGLLATILIPCVNVARHH